MSSVLPPSSLHLRPHRRTVSVIPPAVCSWRFDYGLLCTWSATSDQYVWFNWHRSRHQDVWCRLRVQDIVLSVSIKEYFGGGYSFAKTAKNSTLQRSCLVSRLIRGKIYGQRRKRHTRCDVLVPILSGGVGVDVIKQINAAVGAAGWDWSAAQRHCWKTERTELSPTARLKILSPLLTVSHWQTTKTVHVLNKGFIMELGATKLHVIEPVVLLHLSLAYGSWSILFITFLHHFMQLWAN